MKAPVHTSMSIAKFADAMELEFTDDPNPKTRNLVTLDEETTGPHCLAYMAEGSAGSACNALSYTPAEMTDEDRKSARRWLLATIHFATLAIRHLDAEAKNGGAA